MADRLSVRVAGLTLTTLSDDPELRLEAPGDVRAFVTDEGPADTTIRALRGDPSPRPEGKLLFDSGSLWRAYGEDGATVFRFTSPSLGAAPYKEARFTDDFTRGRVVVNRTLFPADVPAYPLEYPLDELIAIALLGPVQGVVLHACGIADAGGTGYLFAGESGAGKSTTARIWKREAGVTVLSDDRIIVRRAEGGFRMHGTPWHGEASFAAARSAPLSRIFLLRHGQENRIAPALPPAALARLFACSFPPFFSAKGMDRTLRALASLVENVEVSDLSFVPDRALVPFIRRLAP